MNILRILSFLTTLLVLAQGILSAQFHAGPVVSANAGTSQVAGTVLPLEGRRINGALGDGRHSGLIAQTPDSGAVVVYFSDLRIPFRDTLFICSASGARLFAFTSRETRDGGPTATPALPAGQIAWEYYRHPLSREDAVIITEGIGILTESAARSLLQDGPETTGACLVNVNASPEGLDWQDEKRAVVKILLKKGASLILATGALMNNTSLDNTPYVLTSDNCANGATASDLLQTVFYFGHELPGADTAGTPGSWGTISGATFVARGGISCNLHSDFYLVRLNQSLPQSFQPYLLGYDRSGQVEDSVVCIHHKGGIFKQIATSWGNIVSSTYFGGPVFSHWKAYWSQTASGLGVTGNGSNGAPLLNKAGRVIGVWSDGFSSCSSPNNADYFGKLSLSWQQYQSTPATRLKEWLDPENTGAMTLGGMYPTAYPPEAAFSLSGSVFTTGDSLHIVDVSLGSPTVWEWSFPGGQPSQWIGSQPPPVVYSVPGAYDIRLVVNNTSGTDTLLMSKAVKVYPANPLVITSLDTLDVCADTVEVAVRVSNLYHLRNATLTLSHDTSQLQFLGLAGLHPSLSGLNVQAYVQGKDLWVSWTSTAPLQVGNDTLVILRFLAEEGTIPLEWNTLRPWMCQYYGENLATFPVVFMDGMLHAQACGTLNGSLRYAGSGTPLAQVLVHLADSSGNFYRTQTDTDGVFVIRRIMPSLCTLQVAIERPWAGVNSADALLIMRHIVSLDTLTGIFLEAADVNGSGVVNGTDALLAARRFTGLVPAFPAPDWVV
ncbi:MAG: trypsin-like peptidase domain-containing protein, partial [Bacteroidales bacterium]|nr:trypsin-like peptidase domain-containing protein [Bacteroidales bacterium]